MLKMVLKSRLALQDYTGTERQIPGKGEKLKIIFDFQKKTSGNFDHLFFTGRKRPGENTSRKTPIPTPGPGKSPGARNPGGSGPSSWSFGGCFSEKC